MGTSAGRFDGHAHVFRASLPVTEKRRYTADYDAELMDYVVLLRRSKLDGALLVQPSFLGTDNSFLVDTLEQGRSIPELSLRGVAVVDPDVPQEELSRLNDSGVIGVRFNLIGTETAIPFDVTPWLPVFDFANRHDWHIEVHCEGYRLQSVLDPLLDHCARVVVDHFGLPDATSPEACIGQRAIHAAAGHSDRRGRLFVKTSAPYRVFPREASQEAAWKCMSLFQGLLDTLGPENLLWGSDWPWTRFEGRHDFDDALGWQSMWLEQHSDKGAEKRA